jgi:hypothetical protein
MSVLSGFTNSFDAISTTAPQSASRPIHSTFFAFSYLLNFVSHVSGVHTAYYLFGIGALFLSITKVANDWIYTSNLPYALHKVHRTQEQIYIVLVLIIAIQSGLLAVSLYKP